MIRFFRTLHYAPPFDVATVNATVGIFLQILLPAPLFDALAYAADIFDYDTPPLYATLRCCHADAA